ncbi:hypothetical protein VA596_43500 [Amycolatopsis sp., V23-08]|uniref:Uncharacterized protein n=1 Tax=Amycolatopsis heterodermiae TaxID=3110235 RepID=A0ABU5RLR5_9PSEU|nr:hypothetical protein [Amycolatopsis sp., V23-08]MEA5366460.1 hypothetical protein [Amycolatopsis sp., V23-08]
MTALLLLGWTLWRVRRPREVGQVSTPTLEPAAAALPQLSDRASLVPGREDFSFLLAILTGVALSVGVVALQELVSVFALTVSFAELLMFWLTSFGAVALIYLSVKYGAVFIPGRIDAIENVMMMVVTIAECAMFIAVALGPGELLAMRWFISLAAFAFSAGITTTIVWRRLCRSIEAKVADEETVIYAKSLTSDIASACGLFAATVLFVCLWPKPPVFVGLCGGSVAFLICVSEIMKQRKTRQNVL